MKRDSTGNGEALACIAGAFSRAEASILRKRSLSFSLRAPAKASQLRASRAMSPSSRLISPSPALSPLTSPKILSISL